MTLVNRSKRYVLALGTALVGAIGMTGAAQAADTCKELNVLTWEGFMEDAWVKPFETSQNVAVKSLYIGSGDEQIAKLRAGGGDLFDVVTFSRDNLEAVVATGVIAPLDTAKLTQTADYFPFLLDMGKLEGNLYFVPSKWDVNPFLYNADMLKDLGIDEAPTSFEILWDPRLKGKVAVWNEISTLYIAANVLGIDKTPGAVFDMTDEQLDAVLEKLIELKPNIRKIWETGGEAIDLYVNGEVAAGLAWTYIFQEANKRGVKIERAVFENQGAHAWVDGFGLTTGRPECKDVAYEFLNYITSPEVQAAASKHTGYAPANAKAAPLLDPEAVKAYHLDDAENFAKQIIFKVDPKRRDKYIEILNEFKAAP